MNNFARSAGPDTSPSEKVPYRVVIIEDSAVVRGMMSRWLQEAGQSEVLARFGSARMALDRICDLKAEVVVLDASASPMGGSELLPRLLELDRDMKILAVTDSGMDARRGSGALKAAGAHAVLVRPADVRDATRSADFRNKLASAIVSLGQTAKRRDGPRAPAPESFRPSTKPAETDKPAGVTYIHPKASAMRPKILAIGSSTGGPKALYEVFAALRDRVDVPVVITQHMPPMFTGILAEHLTKASGLTAKEGEDGEDVRPGFIYVAPGDYHMVLTGTAASPKISLNQGPEENFCRPAVDPMFRSVAELYGSAALCLILTGMGQDGCKGAGVVVKAGGTVLSQDEETSVVWGMPGAVAKAGLSAEILPLSKIGPRTEAYLKGAVR